MFEPRPMQKEVLAYTGGWMGVSAVPGSGKTHTLSLLAAQLVASGILNEDQEILIVTLVNSAVDNFSARVGNFVANAGLLRDMGYRVRTLHGLAHDIVRERPDLVGLSDRFNIVDERESDEILRSAVIGWLRANPEFYQEWTHPDQDLSNNQYLYKKWEETVISLAQAFVRQSKDLQATPQDLSDRLSGLNFNHVLLELGMQVYNAYQRGLNYRSAVDFADLIRLALLALQSDPDYLTRLRARWPYILEDEAQDSSRLQEEILRLLSGENGNWVRVGDPNQAIYETFTTASPEYLRSFLRQQDVNVRELPDSGRSTRSIIQLANEIIRWTVNDHPVEELRTSLTPPLIRPTQPDDPQPNPVDHPEDIFLYNKKFTPDEEIKAVVSSLKKWLPENTDKTVAVLVPRNERGTKVVQALKNAGIEPVELLQSSLSTRQTADVLAHAMRYLDQPAAANRISQVFKDYTRDRSDEPDQQELIKKIDQLLGHCRNLEDYLWPRPNRNWLEQLIANGTQPEVVAELEQFALVIKRWQSATLLPVDQLVLTIAQDLFSAPAQLALAHSLALILERAAQSHPEWQLSQFVEELSAVARNERRILGFSEEDSGFDPEKYKGKVVVATIHKAKGLEWDRVYLISVNNYDFPSNQPYDPYISEKYFVRDQLNLEAETLQILQALVENRPTDLYLEEGLATRQARVEYASERLRLFFVGITRARSSIIVTWNNGRSTSGGRENQPALAFVHLDNFWRDLQRAHTT
jgi:DNA helicase II / ATP-dependent DNA helicase PcrA